MSGHRLSPDRLRSEYAELPTSGTDVTCRRYAECPQHTSTYSALNVMPVPSWLGATDLDASVTLARGGSESGQTIAGCGPMEWRLISVLPWTVCQQARPPTQIAATICKSKGPDDLSIDVTRRLHPPRRTCQVVSDVGGQAPVRRPQVPAHHIVRLGAEIVHDGGQLARQPVRPAVLVLTAAVLLPAPPDHSG